MPTWAAPGRPPDRRGRGGGGGGVGGSGGHVAAGGSVRLVECSDGVGERLAVVVVCLGRASQRVGCLVHRGGDCRVLVVDWRDAVAWNRRVDCVAV